MPPPALPPAPPPVTRFAPSPTGLLHLGHAFAALTAFDAARSRGGRFLVRIEDIDTGRVRPAFEAALFEDLAWLGVEWETPVRRQSEHLSDYAAALKTLNDMGVLYPCRCTRREIQVEIAAAPQAPHLPRRGPEGPVYPGTCRGRKGEAPPGDSPYALRLDMAAAQQLAGPLRWVDELRGDIRGAPEPFGDVVLARKDTPTSYHLAVTLDDHLQGVNLVTRGEDLFAATHIHRLLQALLGLDTPRYRHHPLIRDDRGQRLAKRAGAATLRSLRAAGLSGADVRRKLGLV